MIRAGQKVTPEEVALLLKEKKEMTDMIFEKDKKIKELQEEKSNTDDQRLLAQKDDEIKLLKKEKCCMVNGSGVNMERFKKEPLPEKPIFFMLSRALRCKGVSEYLEAAQIVHDRYPHVRIMYLGEIVELASSKDLFASPKHPYTNVLLSAVPSIHKRQNAKLKYLWRYRVFK